MAQSKAAPKERHERQRRRREVRRSLAAIAPHNSNPQAHSLLFTELPAEVRFMIFQLVLSQRWDSCRPIVLPPHHPLRRCHCHTHYRIIHWGLLLTCRLVYYEAHAIPIRSATHHVDFTQFGSPISNYERRLPYLTKQSGADLYHLHAYLNSLHLESMSQPFLPHLKWKRITWTLTGYHFASSENNHNEMLWAADILAELQLPASCQEVNLEVGAPPQSWRNMEQFIQHCRNLDLNSKDGKKLPFDPRHAIFYEWHDEGGAHWDPKGTTRPTEDTVHYLTARLCWRATVPRRDYMSYDHSDCLQLQDCSSIIKWTPIVHPQA